MSEFFDTDIKARHVVDDIALIANALEELGIPAGVNLYRCAERLTEHLNTYRAMHVDGISARTKESQQGTANMMNAILAMSELAK